MGAVQAEIVMSYKLLVFRNGHCREKPDTGARAVNAGFTSFHAVADPAMLAGKLLSQGNKVNP
jgi:hypothetical protein